MRHAFFPEDTVKFLSEELEVMENRATVVLLYFLYIKRAREMIAKGDVDFAIGYAKLAKVARKRWKNWEI